MITDARADAFPAGPALAFYGDDFTGSTDAMEATALAGLPTVLFTRPPDEGLRRRFADRGAVGLAGTARARDPDWMETELPGAFAALAGFGAPVMQYKVCSTFDSAPRIGSIGRAIDIGARETGARWLPVVVGAPHLGRWLVFGHLFAAAGGEVFRIDRHPTMSRHPVTPMDESDLARHLAAQTARPVRSLGLDRMAAGGGDAAAEAARADGAALLIDTMDASTMAEAGRLVWEGRAHGVFAAASSGLQHALAAHWRLRGWLPDAPPPAPKAGPVDRLLVLSGSCSPVAEGQIAAAEAAGFARLALDAPAAALGDDYAEAEAARLAPRIAEAFETARGVVVHAARTVDDPGFAALRARCGGPGPAFEAAQARLGQALGEIARRAVPHLALQRLLVAGGDTSGRVVDRLPAAALEVAAAFTPGAPLCRVHAEEGGADASAFKGLELILKGGQIGPPDLFLHALDGAPA